MRAVLGILPVFLTLMSCVTTGAVVDPNATSASVNGNVECKNVGKGPSQYCVTVQFAGGQLGNQLFEVATALSIAKDNSCIAVFPMLTKTQAWNTMNTYGIPPEKLFAGYLPDDAIFSKSRLGAARDASSLD